MNASVTTETLPRFASVEKAVEQLKPTQPLYLLHPEKFAAVAKLFLESFPGTPMYAVKANPAPLVLDQLWNAGIRHFDTASIGEIELIKGRFPDAVCHYMSPLRLPGDGLKAYRDHGVRDFVIDTDYALDLLLRETGNAKDRRIFVRLAATLGGALLELSSKFGTTPEDAARLLKRVQSAGVTPALTFHVGSQCLSSFSYAQAIDIARRAIMLSGVDVRILDIGGGFPAAYAGSNNPPAHWYFDTIREALEQLPNHDKMEVWCEPGRALVAEAVSSVAQVVLRKRDRIYLNDGVYGSFDEITIPGFDEDYPARALTLDTRGRIQPRKGTLTPFRVFGPTCDSMDVLPRAVPLPDTIEPGDFVVFDSMGAYTISSRTHFNGFYPNDWAIVGG
jgi:ornithine decarboxylase